MKSAATTIQDEIPTHLGAVPARTIDEMIDDDLKPAMRLVAAEVSSGVAELQAASGRLRAAPGRITGRRLDFLERASHVLAAHGLADMHLTLTAAGLTGKRMAKAARAAP